MWKQIAVSTDYLSEPAAVLYRDSQTDSQFSQVCPIYKSAQVRDLFES